MDKEQPKEFQPQSFHVVNSDHNVELAIAKILAEKMIFGIDLGVKISEKAVPIYGLEFVEVQFTNPEGKEIFDKVHRSPEMLALFEQMHDKRREKPDPALVRGSIQQTLNNLFD